MWRDLVLLLSFCVVLVHSWLGVSEQWLMADIKTRFLRAAFPVQMEWVMLCEHAVTFQFHPIFLSFPLKG